MIRTQEEYTNACNFIDSDMELYDFQLSEKMSSYEYNLYLQDTEYFLNYLYEKIRTLEDLCDYLDTYIDIKIGNAKQIIDIDTELLDKTLEAYTNQQTTSVTPIWNDNISKHLTDRDGSILPVAELEGTDILPAATKTNKIVPQMITRDKENNTYSNLVSRDLSSYLVSYQSSGTIPKEETVRVVLPENAVFNCVDIEPINCVLTVFKDQHTLLITMQPNGYDKEIRNFDFDAYNGAALNRVVTQNQYYDKADSVCENLHALYNQKQKAENRQYMHSVLSCQQVMSKNTEKAKTIGGTV